MSDKKSRRERGTGSVRWVEARQRWELRVTVREGLDKPRRLTRWFAGKNTKAGEKAAERARVAWQEELVRAAHRGELRAAAPRQNILLNTYATRESQGWPAWLAANTVTDDHPDRRLRPRVADEYRLVYAKRVAPRLGHRPLASLRPSDADALATALSATGLAPASVRRAVAVLRSVLTAAERDGLVTPGMARSMPLPSGAMRRDTRVATATPEQLAALLSDACTRALGGDPVAAALLLAASAGLRRSEALAARWSALDWETGTLTVAEGVTERQDGTLVLGRTKARNSERTVGLPPAVMSVLREVRKARPGTVFIAEAARTPGMPTRPSQAARAATPLLRAAGIAEGGWHALRHGWEEAALAAGADPLAVARAAGQDPKTMLNHYAGPQAKGVLAVGERMAEVLAFDAPEAV